MHICIGIVYCIVRGREGARLQQKSLFTLLSGRADGVRSVSQYQSLHLLLTILLPLLILLIRISIRICILIFIVILFLILICDLLLILRVNCTCSCVMRGVVFTHLYHKWDKFVNRLERLFASQSAVTIVSVAFWYQ